MDITNLVVQGRDKALLYGDYSTYHSSLVKRLLNVRKKLGISTRNRGKFRRPEQVTVENVSQNPEYVRLLLLTSERAWAHAMSMKSAHAADEKGIAGRSRAHIISRLHKAARTAEELVRLLSQSEASGATINDVLEARAYASLIRGTMQFQKYDWEHCLQSYATTHVIYTALTIAGKGDVFKDLLSETVDPSIRYAAYQLKTPRTVPILTIARKAFPQSDDALVQEINRIDPSILGGTEAEAMDGVTGPGGSLKTLTWRSREVRIEHAQIATAWEGFEAAKQRLADTIGRLQDKGSHEIAAAYDEILTATQDAVDATKEAIDELKGEGVGQGDPRMQSLQITRTAVNYEMISWRIGRNRVLTGPFDGATEEYGSLRRKKKAATAEERRERELPPSKKLAKLKEKAALYDGTLQNLESVKELPGVAADDGLAAKIEAYEKYFTALKCLAIARSHAIAGSAVNALALIHRSLSLHSDAASRLPEAETSSSHLLQNMDVSPEAFSFLGKLLDGEMQRHRAIVHVDNLQKEDKAGAAAAAPSHRDVPLIDRLNEYPLSGVDLNNIVEFPPKMALVPVKPIFLDVAWNYIQYPGKTLEAAISQANANVEPAVEPAAAPKRGWFGFGR